MTSTVNEELGSFKTKPGRTQQLYILKEVSSLQATHTLFAACFRLALISQCVLCNKKFCPV